MPEWHGANGTGLKTCRKAWREGHHVKNASNTHTHSNRQEENHANLLVYLRQDFLKGEILKRLLTCLINVFKFN